MRLLDRYIIKSFLLNYLLAFAVMVGMYTLLDLIVNIGKFSSGADKSVQGIAQVWSLMADIGDFYFFQLLVIFQQVSGVIPVMAAGFTMVRLTRHNELTAMLASGVSLYRIALPIILCSVVFSLLVVVDQEFLMPRAIDKLMRQHDEVNRPVTRNDPLYFVRDPNDGSLLMASSYDPASKTIKDLRLIRRDKDGTPIGRTMAPIAKWNSEYPVGPGLKGAWDLPEAREIDDRPSPDPSSQVAEVIGSMHYITPLTPAQIDLVFTKKAVDFLSSAQIKNLIINSPDVTRMGLEKIMHIRFTQPLMNMVMLLIGIPFLLTREPGRLVKNMMYCTAVSGTIFVATFVFFQMAGSVLPPILGAWMPVVLFAPMAVAMLDTIKT